MDNTRPTGRLAAMVLRALFFGSSNSSATTITSTPYRTLNQRQKRRDARRAGRPVKPRKQARR